MKFFNTITESLQSMIESNYNNDNYQIALSQSSCKERKDGKDCFYDIIINGNKVGKIGISFFDDINSLGLGSFEIDKNERNNGYGTKVIEYIIDTYKDKYDLIYCYVDADNGKAINFYKKIGKVYDKLNDNNQYFVTFYDNRKKLQEGLFTKYDSEGNKLTAWQARTFRKSKVRDDKGRLSLCYHATNNDFEVFDIKYSKHSRKFGVGFYFNRGRHLTGFRNLMEVYVNIEKPITADSKNIKDETWKEFLDAINMKLDGIKVIQDDGDLLNYRFISEWYHGDLQLFLDKVNQILKVDGIIDDDLIVAFKPNNIKSIYNLSPNLHSDNITEQFIEISDDEDDSYACRNYEDDVEEKLIQGKSKKTLQKNIETEIKAGRDPKQAVAIAYSIKDKNESFDFDGNKSDTNDLREYLSRPVNDLTGKQFGELTVIGLDKERTRYGKTYWRCKCSCGNETSVDAGNLKSGLIKSCGHTRRNDLTGKKFGDLTVIELDKEASNKNGRPYWKCQCSCGNEVSVRGSHLTSGRIKNCGHLKPRMVGDLTNQRFGELIVIGLDKERTRPGKPFWKCRCSCGNEISVNATPLKNGRTKSCGHIRKELFNNTILKNHTIDNKYNTNLDVIARKEPNENNKLGIRGIYLLNGYYCASIRFANNTYRKRFKSLDQAKIWYERMKEHLHDPIIKQAIDNGDFNGKELSDEIANDVENRDD